MNAERKLIRTVEEDPRDLTAARKYLDVYLTVARDATIKFADIYARSRNTQTHDDYSDLLVDLSDNIAANTCELLIDDRSDLNIKIDVPCDGLKHENQQPIRDPLKENKMRETLMKTLHMVQCIDFRVGPVYVPARGIFGVVAAMVIALLLIFSGTS